MSLAARLLLVIVLLNGGVVGVVQVAALFGQRQAVEAQNEIYRGFLARVLQDAYLGEKINAGWVRELLALEGLRSVFRDFIVVSGGLASTADLNPLGAARRDRVNFPRVEITRGLAEALRREADGSHEPVPVSGGFCVAIETRGNESAAAWYVPAVLPSGLPFGLLALSVLLATLLTAAAGFVILRRSLARPLDGLARAATRLGAGDLDARVQRVSGARELDGLVDAFNAMAARIAGHTDELKREVERATQETAARERALVVSSRLAAMGTLAAGIAHEINNPIGGMINAVHRLKQREGLSERDALYLDLVREGLDRVGAIAAKVLDFSPRQIDARRFPLAAAVEGARSLVEHRCRQEAVELRVAVPEDLPELVGDRHEIQQVLLNCLINSLDVLGGVPEPRRIDVRAARAAGDAVEIVVADNGPGADAETLQRVFDPFFSRKEHPEASGLGLFISYSIIQNHGGELRVESPPPPARGFRVIIRLPLPPSAAAGDEELL